MDVLSQSNQAPNYSPIAFVNNEISENEKDALIDGHKKDKHIFRLNPMLNESLNNLVKRFERTKIPKPPPTKGQSIRKKSKLSNSLPNIFLPPGFDDHKYSNNEKKVQWTNKLNLNLDKLKNAFSETYNVWCSRKRSLSIPSLEKNINDNISIIALENCNVDSNLNSGHKNIYNNEMLSKKPLTKLDLLNTIDLNKIEQQAKVAQRDPHESSEFEDIPSYTTHVYLDGAIIEPISPASPVCLADQSSMAIDDDKKPTEHHELFTMQSDNNVKPLPRKKGRPKKILTETKVKENKSNSTIPLKPTLKKKQKRLAKMSNKNDELPSFSSNYSDDILESSAETQVTQNSEKLAKTKKSKMSSKQISQGSILSIDSIITSESIDRSLSLDSADNSTPKKNKVLRQNRSAKAKNQNFDLSEEFNNTISETSTPKTRNLSKLTIHINENVAECIASDKIENSCDNTTSNQKKEILSHQDKPKNDNLQSKVKSVLTKKQKKSVKQSKSHRKNTVLVTESLASEENVVDLDDKNVDTTVDKITLTKKQRQLLKQKPHSTFDAKCDLNLDLNYENIVNFDLVPLIPELNEHSKDVPKVLIEEINAESEPVDTTKNIVSKNMTSSDIPKTIKTDDPIRKNRKLTRLRSSESSALSQHNPTDSKKDYTVNLAPDCITTKIKANSDEGNSIVTPKKSTKIVEFSIESHLNADTDALCETATDSNENVESEKNSDLNKSSNLSKKLTESVENTLYEHVISGVIDDSVVPKTKELSENVTCKVNIDVPDSSFSEQSVIPKLKKRGPKKSRKGIEDHPTLTKIDDINTLTTNGNFQSNLNLKPNDNVEVEEVVPVDNRRRLQRTNHNTTIELVTATVEVVKESYVYESLKKNLKAKPGPKCKKRFLKADDLVSQIDVEKEPVVSSNSDESKYIPHKSLKRGRPKLENKVIDVQVNLVEEISVNNSFANSALVIVVEDIPECVIPLSSDETVELDVIKPDVPELFDQSNDIEVLSKSITDSVDTSMLPPRKRYKRLMYLDTSKQMSPKESELMDNVETVSVENVVSQEPEIQAKEDMSSKKIPTYRKLKRKKAIATVDDIVVNNSNNNSAAEPIVVDDEIKDELVQELVPDTEKPALTLPVIDIIDKPSSLKRSKREAAARGFANMVAMSLNNSSQSHENSSDFNKKSIVTKLETAEEVSTEISNSKTFKRPKKTTLTNIGNIKIKGKLSKSFDFSDEADDDVEEVEPSKVLTKKQKISKDKISNLSIKENPPSPVDTVISNDNSIQDIRKYRKIRSNIYVDTKPLHCFQEVERCACKPSSRKKIPSHNENYGKTEIGVRDYTKLLENVVWDCTDNCINRLTYTECNPKTCPCVESCNNQRIRKLDWFIGLKVTEIQSKGRGVISSKSIREGTFIIEYVGEVISEVAFQERMINVYKEDMHHYCLHLDDGVVIDGYRCGSVARFVNHSCQPNCEMQKWVVNGCYRMCLFATEDIEPDTELTYDYNFCSVNTKTTQICLCGAANCRGFIGGRPRSEPAVSENNRKKMFFAFGRTLLTREKMFVLQRSVFLVRERTLGRCRRLGIQRTKQTHGLKLPSTISEIKRRKTKKNQFLTQLSTLNSVRSIRTTLLQNTEGNDCLTRIAQLTQVLRDLYNSLLELKDPVNSCQQLVAPFINCLKRNIYPEFYSTVGQDATVSLQQVYIRLLDGKYTTMMAFDQDILQMIQNIELYAGRQSNIGKCAEQLKPIYKDLKMNAIALYEALTDEMVDDKDKNKLMSNNLAQITNAVKSLSSNTECDPNDTSLQPKSKKRKQGPTVGVGTSRGRLERGAEVIKCVCGFLIEAGHVMVQCDRCFVWQHAYCMNVARSTELVDVTRMEPYYCHMCLNIPIESLVREIPRHFVITDETIDSGNTLFWTLLHPDKSLLKIDDFVYIPSEDETNQNKAQSSDSLTITDLSQWTIMRIYSLWKDSSGQRWMEGGLFLRPYHSYLKSLSESRTTNSETTNKRKASTAMNLTTHIWHQQEVVYTDLTKILPVSVCVGICHVLNNHTFRLGKPLLQNSVNIGFDNVYLCDWLINKSGEWSEIDPAYMKINMKPYCFERYTDTANTSDPTFNGNEKFLRQYTAEELLKLDQGAMATYVEKNVKVKCDLGEENKKLLQAQIFDKLISKLSEFAYDRNRSLPLSSPSSIASQSNPSSRCASPLPEMCVTKSTKTEPHERFLHHPRKSVLPKKNIITPQIAKCCAEDQKPKTIASEYSEGSPKLIIVVEEDRVTKVNTVKFREEEEVSIIDDKSSDKVSSSNMENYEDRSNPCSEIKYGDLLDLLKETVKVKSKPKPKCKTSKILLTKVKKKTNLKKNVIKPVSEINSIDDNWEPIGSRLVNLTSRRETRSRRSHADTNLLDEHGSVTVPDTKVDLEENEDDGRKTCFVKLERIRVNKAEKNKQKRTEKEQAVDAGSACTTMAPMLLESDHGSLMLPQLSKIDNISSHIGSSDNVPGVDDDAHNPNSLSAVGNNRSKRKKGVPKRIPFDYTYQPINSIPKTDESGITLTYDYEVVDLSAGKSSQTDKPDQTTTECQKIESPELLAAMPKLPKPVSLTVTEARHITAANDFSSIENISSN